MRFSAIAVRFAKGLKLTAMHLCEMRSIKALKNRMACAVLMSDGDLIVEINSWVFFISEKDMRTSSKII